jgi:RimJ/RimL family protein N-acetyltransferase
LEPLAAHHASGLWEAFDGHPEIWRYMPIGPFDAASYAAWVDGARLTHDPFHMAVRMADGRLGGTMSLLRINPAAGSIEVGYIAYAPRLQRTVEASEAVILLANWALGVGYRRFEWKCNAANEPSMRAAIRYGFTYEGTHRQAGVVKGANRDTAWYSILDGEWPVLRAAWAAWLNPENFEDGRQRTRLSDLTAG